ncbi:hypothetical protein [Tetragenococcus koreensis]|uniref:hypothetical protein n=1 Tax=Tetragenococcus koreensis TaxID=290335 RepID=UPI001195CBFF|nr:hypothetical protein [Tetragenococcus koreensis]GEN90008.1 hypothetical protein TKO01_00540 [Tetragenococcus koreensis]
MIIKGQTKVENYIDFQDVEPKNPVKGQKYYDGDKVVTWTGNEWKTVVNPTQLEKDVANAAQAGENAGVAADEAMTEAKEARTRANSAVDKADKANEDITIISNTVNGHTSQISSLGDNLNLRVKKDDVINQINISDESILIDGAKTHITGKTTIDEGIISTAHIKDAAITSAKIKSITAGKIEAGTVKGITLTSETGIGNFKVEGPQAVFENTETKEKAKLSENGLLLFNKNNQMQSQITQRMVNSSYFGTSNINTYITVGSIGVGDDVADEGSGEFRVVDYDPRMAQENGMGDGRDDYTYLNMRANALFANVIRVNYAERKDGVVNNNLYLQPRWGYEVRLTAPGTTGGNSTYQDLRAKDLYANVLQSNNANGDNHVYIRPINSGELRVMNPDNTSYRNVRMNNAYVANIVKPAAGDLYIGTSGGLMIQGRGLWEDGNWRPVYAQSFNNKSLASLKTDIKKYPDGALNVINGSDIYNYKTKADKGSKYEATKVGLVIGEGYQSPKCVQSDDGTGIDVYSMASVAWKAIQELSQETKDLRSEIDILRRELNNE